MGNEVVNWSERLASSAKEVAALERPSLSTVSVRSGMLSYMGQPVPGNKLRVVIVASAFQNRYYDKPFDPNNPANPVCFALSLDGIDMVPDPASTEIQNPSCSGCPKNEWKSDPKGGKGKACKAARRLVLIPESSATSELAKKAEMAMMTLPVTSQKNWANYVNGIASEYQRPPWGMITEITVVPDPKTQFQVKFDAVGMVPEEALGPVNGRIEAAQVVLMQPYDEEGLAKEKEAAKAGSKPKDGKKY